MFVYISMYLRIFPQTVQTVGVLTVLYIQSCICLEGQDSTNGDVDGLSQIHAALRRPSDMHRPKGNQQTIGQGNGSSGVRQIGLPPLGHQAGEA